MKIHDIWKKHYVNSLLYAQDYWRFYYHGYAFLEEKEIILLHARLRIWYLLKYFENDDAN